MTASVIRLKDSVVSLNNLIFTNSSCNGSGIACEIRMVWVENTIFSLN
jgi:hypothetical protein